jgi:hypothetical protein
VRSVVEGGRVDGIDLVLPVEVGVETVHHHHELAGGRASSGRIHDQRPVKPFVDVPLQRDRMAVIRVDAKRLRRKFVREPLTRLDDREHPIHGGRVGAVEVDRVGV